MAPSTTSLDNFVDKLRNELNITLKKNETESYYKDILQAYTFKDIESHPLFEALPSKVFDIQSYKDFSLFREGSQQWDILHIGRLSSSSVAAIIGIFEPQTAKFVKVPRFLVSHERAIEAFERIKQPNLFDDLNKYKSILINNTLINPITEVDLSSYLSEGYSVGVALLKRFKEHQKFACFRDYKVSNKLSVNWIKDESNKFPLKSVLVDKFEQKVKCIHSDLGKVRREWGRLQEPTSILHLINYATSINAKIKQIGLLPCEALDFKEAKTEDCLKQVELLKRCQEERIKIGVTPDALLIHSDNSIEPLEMKNHAPFTSYGRGIEVRLGEGILDNSEIPLSYLPQIQLEIFCTSFQCKSALLLRKTAAAGALLYRVYRDDNFIQLILQQVLEFNKEYVQKNKKPPTNFVQTSMNNKLKASLRRIANKATIVKRFSAEEIQKHPLYANSL